jgi:hypothetical protein
MSAFKFKSNSSTLPLSKDWREFLELLNSHGADYLIVDAQSLVRCHSERSEESLIISESAQQNSARDVSLRST